MLETVVAENMVAYGGDWIYKRCMADRTYKILIYCAHIFECPEVELSRVGGGSCWRLAHCVS